MSWIILALALGATLLVLWLLKRWWQHSRERYLREFRRKNQ